MPDNNDNAWIAQKIDLSIEGERDGLEKKNIIITIRKGNNSGNFVVKSTVFLLVIYLTKKYLPCLRLCYSTCKRLIANYVHGDSLETLN